MESRTFFGVTSEFFTGKAADVDPYLGDSILFLIIGIVFTATLPFVTRGLTWMHYAIARGMLSAFLS